MVRDVTLTAATPYVERAVRLPEGRYDVTAHFGASPTTSIIRPLEIEGAGRYVVDLRE